MGEERPQPEVEGQAGDARREEHPALRLSDEIARRYDASALSKLVLDGAGRGERLEHGTQLEMERRLGGRFADVRVFRGPFAEAITRAHRADAVTVANTGMILVRESGRANLASASGKALLAHELTHVAQAQRGLHFARESGGDSAPHEREAEAVEAAVYADATRARSRGGEAALRPEQVVARILELFDEELRIKGERFAL